MLPGIKIDVGLRDTLRLHCFRFDDVDVTPAGTEQQQTVGLLEQELRARWAGCSPAQIPGLQAARGLYRRTGLDPTRTRPSSEALLRRVLKGQSLYQVNNLVDAGNELSLRLLLPLGLYDLDQVKGCVTVRLGHDGEEYPGIRKDVVHLQGRLGLFDNDGPFGSPTSDSPRTCITEQTRSALLVLYLPAGLEEDRVERAAALGKSLFPGRCGCRLVAEALVR